MKERLIEKDNVQCFDSVNAYWNFLTGGRLAGVGAKDIPFSNNFTGLAKVFKNTPTFLAEAGDIVVWGASLNGGYGHTAIVVEATLDYIIVVEQNWLGGGWTNGAAKGGTGWEKVTKRKHSYATDMWFIRPIYKTSTLKKVAKTIKKKTPAKLKKKKKILLIAGHGIGYTAQGQKIDDPGAVGNGTTERDYIRRYIVPNVAKYLKMAGNHVDLYGGTKMNQDCFRDTAYGLALGNRKDYGMYWVARKKYDMVIEFHLDAAGATASGGHTIIAAGLNPDNTDKAIQSVIKSNVGVIRGIDGRNNLLNVNVAKDLGVNYRLVELGFITSKKDMDYIKSNYEKYCLQLAEAIHGRLIVKQKIQKKASSTASTSDKKKVATASKSNIVTHTVKDNDTLWNISQKYGISIEKLKEFNKGIQGNTIYEKQVLIVQK